MARHNLAKIYAELPIPVVICGASPAFHIEYTNVAAALMFSPSHSALPQREDLPRLCLADIIDCGSVAAFDSFCNMLATAGRVDGFLCNAITFEGAHQPVAVYANSIRYEGADLFALYLIPQQMAGGTAGTAGYDSRLASIINATILEEDTDDAIDTVLALSGATMMVSRVYIFEEISPTTTANTYEWCAPGIEPAIDDLQNLDKDDYPYDDIINSGMYIVSDVSTIDEPGRSVLEMQGIKAVAIIPMYDATGPLGYAGFDDCDTVRDWSSDEITFLKSIAMFLAALMKRRNDQRNLVNSKNVLQIISDNTKDLVYANRLDDYSLVFVSRSMAETLGKTEAELLGQPCWKVFQKGMDGPCPFCPIPHINYDEVAAQSDTYHWEQHNTLTGRTYLAQDSIVRWVDGQLVHMEVATDITFRTEYEENLKRVASVDAMTGVYNREFGARTLDEKMAQATGECSLCFIDLDGLKKTNDTLGHAAGDEMIVSTLRILQDELTDEDFICRWGGDEFLVWMNRDIAAAEAVMARATETVRRHNETSQSEIRLGFSYGVVAYRPGTGQTLDSMVTVADELMYRNKMEKRGLHRRREDH